MKTLTVRFRNTDGRLSQNYTYRSDKDLKVGDIVLAPVGHNGASIGIVTSINHIPSTIGGYKDILDIANDWTDYTRKWYNEGRKKALKAEMDKRIKTLDEKARYAVYAMLDPEFKATFEEYYGLD